MKPRLRSELKKKDPMKEKITDNRNHTGISCYPIIYRNGCCDHQKNKSNEL